MDKKYWNKGAFMTDLNQMIVADEQNLDQIQDPVIRESVAKQLEVRLPVHPDKVLIKIECVGVCGSDFSWIKDGTFRICWDMRLQVLLLKSVPT